MKNLRFAILLLVVFICSQSYSQSDISEEVSRKINNQMKDNLGLSDTEVAKLNQVNLKLHQHKMEVRKLFAETDSLSKYMQRIENSRDSLYSTILSKEKYSIYLKNKKQLINVKE